jgi:hypothetical protein
MRGYPLTTSKSGMTRLVSKGGAGKDTLYDLLNGYINQAGRIKPRPGTQTDITLPTDTKGLVTHKCRLYTFNHEPTVTSNPDKYVVATLRHPTDPTKKLRQIHFSAPFMGFLYVAAEFEDGNTWHYWLEELDAWTPNTDYKIGDRVFPTTENGFAYRATRPGSPYPVWTANTKRAVGDVVEPTTYNGFKYTVIATSGENPASGEYEPDWPTETGAQVIEYSQADSSATIQSTTTGYPGYVDYGNIPDRYSNPAGGFTGTDYSNLSFLRSTTERN